MCRHSILIWLLACGARTGIPVPSATHDAAVSDAGVDAFVPECRRDRDCDDGLDCTADDCRRGTCEHRARDGRCELSSICHVGRCDLLGGCVSDEIPCNDSIACTIDTCNEDLGCHSIADDDSCAISHRCDEVRGCVARALIHDSERLYEVDLPSGDFRTLTPTDPRLTDIALATDRRLYGVSFDALYELDISTTTARRIRETDRWVALEAGPDNTLLAAGQDERVFSIELPGGRATQIARLPDGWVAAGDIAFVEGRMLITISDVPSSETEFSQLAEIDSRSGETRFVGSTGYPCIWALAAFGDTLYGFSCHGHLIRIDPFSGTSELLRLLPLRIGGAAAR